MGKFYKTRILVLVMAVASLMFGAVASAQYRPTSTTRQVVNKAITNISGVVFECPASLASMDSKDSVTYCVDYDSYLDASLVRSMIQLAFPYDWEVINSWGRRVIQNVTGTIAYVAGWADFTTRELVIVYVIPRVEVVLLTVAYVQ